MGLIKRALKRTSRKLLAKFMAPAHTHQLVLNPPLQTGDISPVHLSSSQSRKMRKLSSLRRKFRKSSSSKDTAVAEALLLAVKNYLPPLQFHHIHGPHAQLSQNKCVARRTQSFCQALVFSNRVILPNERVYIKVLEISKCWSGTIRFGFTAVDPATLACKMPKHACPDMTNAGHTWARALADEVVRRNSVIHFSYNKHGIIHYGINNQDCGIFHANVGTNQNLWFIVDIYGLTAAVELIDPRVNKATTGELDFAAHIDAELAQANHHDRSSTMFKSTSAMDELFGGRHHGSSAGNGGGLTSGSSSGRLRKKQSRKHARQLALIQGNWPLENYSAGANFHSLHLAQQQQQHQQQQLQHGAMQLPNLNSITLPSVQQNIYTPMPNPGVDPGAHQRHHRPDMHDYQQIMSNTYGSSGLYQAARAPKLTNSISMANLSHVPQSVYGTSANSSSTSATNRQAERSVASINQVDLSDQLEQMHLHDKRPRQHQQQSSPSMVASASKSSKSSSSVVTSQLPVAATRKRQQQINSVQTNLKRTPESARDRPDKAASAHRIVSSKSHASPAASSSSSSSSLTTTTATATATTRQAATSSSYTGSSSQANVKPKTRHSIKNHKSISAKDSNNNNNNNNNSPPSKDCPICFERPINCVLYQCGHMCTCYECGVKQWKTQSRTCPICRTIIKDVIKTYLS